MAWTVEVASRRVFDSGEVSRVVGECNWVGHFSRQKRSAAEACTWARARQRSAGARGERDVAFDLHGVHALHGLDAVAELAVRRAVHEHLRAEDRRAFEYCWSSEGKLQVREQRQRISK